MSATSDGNDLSSVMNETFEFREGSENGYQNDPGELQSTTSDFEGDCLTVSQLYNLANKETIKQRSPSKRSGNENCEPSDSDDTRTISKQSVAGEVFMPGSYKVDQMNSVKVEPGYEEQKLMSVLHVHNRTAKESAIRSEQNYENELKTTQPDDLAENTTKTRLNSESEIQSYDRNSDNNEREDKLVYQEVRSTTSMDINQSTDLNTNELIGVLSKTDGNKLDNAEFETKATIVCSKESISEDLRNCVEIQLPQNKAACADIKSVASDKQDQSGAVTPLGSPVLRTRQEAQKHSGEAVSDRSPNKICQESGLDVSFNTKSDALVTEAHSSMNPGSSVIKKYTSDKKCDINWQNDIIGRNEVNDETENKVFKGQGDCDKSDNDETKSENNCSSVDVLAKVESSASGHATNGPRENTVTLCGENDSNRDKLPQWESNLVGNTCLDSKIYSDVYRLDKEISSVLEKCEYLLQRPDLTAEASSSTNSDWGKQNFLEDDTQISHINCKTLGYQKKKTPCLDVNQESLSVDTNTISIASQSSQVSTHTMGGTNSIEKLEKIRVRSKRQDGNDLYISRNYKDVDLGTTLDECQAFGSSKKECYAIKGTILPNMENSLFSEKDVSGSIQGNYEQSHQMPGRVSHEFNHLGKPGDCDSAISAITESRNQGFLTCSENTEKSNSDLCDHKVKSSSRTTSGSSEANHPNESQNLISNQMQGEDHKESQDSTSAGSHDDVVLRKGILRSPNLRSPKMSPMLRERRFRHGTAGSLESGSGSDQESVDSQRSEDSEDDDEDAGNV